jgi:hypothetical protein
VNAGAIVEVRMGKGQPAFEREGSDLKKASAETKIIR